MVYSIKGEAEVGKGLGLPRLTTVQRSAYTPPAVGYQVWDTTLNKVFAWDGTAWVSPVETLGRVADITARDALTGMGVGDVVTTLYPSVSWRYDGSAWQVWDNGQGSHSILEVSNASIPDDYMSPMVNGRFHGISITAGGAALTVGFPTNGFSQADDLEIHITSANTARDVTFHSVYKDETGQNIGTITTSADPLAIQSFIFRKRTIATAGTDEYWLVGGSAYPVVKGSGTYATVLDITARDNITGMNAGDLVTTRMPWAVWRYDGSAWQLWPESNEQGSLLLSPQDQGIANNYLDPWQTTRSIRLSAATDGPNLTVGYPSTNFTSATDIYIEIYSTTGGLTRVFDFDTAYKDEKGNPIGAVTVASTADGFKSFIFRRRTFETDGTAQFWLVGGTEFSGGGSGDRTFETITQAAHGFTVNQAVYHNGTNWSLAQADSDTSVAQAIVTNVVDINTFEITTHGVVTVSSHGLTVGQYYWLDQGTPGLITATQPTSGISQGLVHVRDANTLFVDVEQAISVAGSSISTLAYLNLSLSANQALSLNPAPNFAVWDQVRFTNGELTMNTNGSVTLLAGRTYKLTASLRHPGVVASSGDFVFWDNTGNAEIGDRIALYPINASGQDNDLPTQTAIFKPTVDSEVGVRYIAGTMSDISPYSSFVIEELPAQTIVPAGAVTPENLDYAYLRAVGTGAGGTNVDTITTVAVADWTTTVPAAAQRLTLTPAAADLQGLTVTGDQLVVAKTGRYTLSFLAGVSVSTNAVRFGLGLYKNGTDVMVTAVYRSNEAGNEKLMGYEWEGDLTAGDVIDIRAMQSAGTNASLQVRQYTIALRQTATQSVIAPDSLPTSDQTSSGYFDMGNMRIQWGRTSVAASSGAITLPAAFANANYTITGTVDGSSGRIVTTDSAAQSATSFFHRITDHVGQAEARTFQWMAIGQKP